MDLVNGAALSDREPDVRRIEPRPPAPRREEDSTTLPEGQRRERHVGDLDGDVCQVDAVVRVVLWERGPQLAQATGLRQRHRGGERGIYVVPVAVLDEPRHDLDARRGVGHLGNLVDAVRGVNRLFQVRPADEVHPRRRYGLLELTTELPESPARTARWPSIRSHVGPVVRLEDVNGSVGIKSLQLPLLQEVEGILAEALFQESDGQGRVALLIPIALPMLASASRKSQYESRKCQEFFPFAT